MSVTSDSLSSSIYSFFAENAHKMNWNFSLSEQFLAFFILGILYYQIIFFQAITLAT